MEAVLKMQREEMQKNLLQLAASSNNSSALTQSSKDVERTNIEKFNVPSEYPVGIDLPRSISEPRQRCRHHSA